MENGGLRPCRERKRVLALVRRILVPYDADESSAVADVDVVEERHGPRHLELAVVAEEPGREDLRLQALHPVWREPPLEETGRIAVGAPGWVLDSRAELPLRDQPPVPVHPDLVARVFGHAVRTENKLSALGGAWSRSHRWDPDKARVDEEGAHGERGGAAHRDERDDREHHEKPATTVPDRARRERPPAYTSAHPADDVSPVARERLGRERREASGQQIVFVRAHAITSSVESTAASCWCAWDRVAATVPSAIPSTSPISAYERSA